MALLHVEPENRDARVVQHFLSAGEMLPSQLPTASTWSPEKKLAAAVLASALVEVRDRHADKSYQRKVKEDVEWIFSEEAEWPFSFIRICELFGLEVDYVRGMVRKWLAGPAPTVYRQCSAHRHAA